MAHQSARRGGLSKAEAKQKAEQTYTQTILDPNNSIKDLMAQEAKIRTFQGNLEGYYKVRCKL